ncbi:tetratricopeptide repeat protein [Actimicrobium sp. CCC2.4]|uniref:tetratricopeptide repeat protein n=1 Tax=Actimicrobium sp. CCC2.4 TaxID=3048606 RepID=UPI002AC934BA|nr:tetratricopeptide repeat protein [Actimicrobium sp. CCC2.4]MEB0134284.1 tetratricopeptide repeat protein [Actimicrobium sp. CCC2.4]WPX32930.1 tetratricopeptide repeat protein [Actimicrobium sp. CCC2.4]
MKTALAIVTLSTLLSACAGLPGPISSANAATIGTPATSAIANVPEEPSISTEKYAGDGLPVVELTEELMFKLLSAEIAFQRGDWQPAYINMISVAQQTRDPRAARRAAEIAIAAKQPEEAMVAVRFWRALAPKSDEATQYYVGMILLGDDLSEFREVFELRLRDVRPVSRPLLILQVQRLLLRAKDKKEAFEVMENLVAPYPDLAETHIALAQAAFNNNDPVRARSEAMLALKAKPDSEIAALTLAQVIPDKKEAAQSLQTYLSSHPDSREIRIAYGRLLIEQTLYDQARKEFETLLKGQPEDLTTLFALGILGTQTTDLKSAEQYLTTYLNVLAAHPEENRDPAQALLVLSQIAEERKDIDAALAYLARIEAGDAYFGAQIKRAQLMGQRGELTSARQLLAETSGTSEREQILVIQTDAQVLRDSDLQQQAYLVLETGALRFPENIDVLYDYAMAAEKLNRVDRMEAALRKVIKLAPTNQHAYNALGYSLAERNVRLPEAFKLIEQALTLAPDDPFIMDSMGWVQYRMGKLPEAETLLRRAYALRQDAEIAVHLGEVLWVRGEKIDAQRFWRDARSKDPKNDSLKNTLTRLQVKL